MSEISDLAEAGEHGRVVGSRAMERWMHRVEIDPNVRVRGNQTFSGISDVEWPHNSPEPSISVGDFIEVYESEEDVVGIGVISEIDLKKGLIYVYVSWDSLHPVVPKNVLLQGVVGSTAYGLNGPDSDIDELGIFAYDTEDLFRLSPFKDSIVTHSPDITYHEVGKAAKLLLGCNPTMTEILWLKEYGEYELQGRNLLDIRNSFLSEKKVRDSYFGYASQQLTRLVNKVERVDEWTEEVQGKRIAKAARHLKRLLTQGFELYTTGFLSIVVDNPQEYLDFGEAVKQDVKYAKELLAEAEKKFDEAKCVLPSAPDIRKVQEWVNQVRGYYYV